MDAEHIEPTYASWLSQIEIWFSIFTRDVIREGFGKANRNW